MSFTLIVVSMLAANTVNPLVQLHGPLTSAACDQLRDTTAASIRFVYDANATGPSKSIVNMENGVVTIRAATSNRAVVQLQCKGVR